MPISVSMHQLLIASPSDVAKERAIIRRIVAEWNSIYARTKRTVVVPVGWETHSTPELGDRVQGIINYQIVDDCDLLIGVFWTRIGTPTGVHEGGAVEEIKRHHSRGRLAMLYFSDAPIPPSQLDASQYEKLKEFRDWCRQNGLAETYNTLDEFHDKIQRQLSSALESGRHMRVGLGSPAQTVEVPDIVAAIPEAALELLKIAVQDKLGLIMLKRFSDGSLVTINQIRFGDATDRHSVTHWKQIIHDLCESKLIDDATGRGELFRPTKKAYDLVASQNN